MKEINIVYATEPAVEAIAHETAEAIKSGEVAIFPTETVYGIGCLMNNASAVERIFEIKGRDRSKPLPVMVDCTANIEKAAFTCSAVKKFEGVFMPGPLTVILKKKPNVSDIISAGRDTVAIRIPNHPFLLAVLKELGEPIVATSANFSGHPAPSAFEELEDEIKKAADIGIDMGPSAFGQASTIADLTENEIKILRQGTITIEQLTEQLNRR